MTDNQIAYAAQLFRTGATLTASDRAGFTAILNRMDEAERAGAIAALIKIMLGI